ASFWSKAACCLLFTPGTLKRLKEGSKQPYSKSWRRSLPQSLTRYGTLETVSLSIRALGYFLRRDQEF
ncbi:MAG: hypothetical protein NTX50_23095, partial [Candidatus Sumerlaeota bacterium]|nr:hypothetical protein [Candidatus Sumerlaeota bacterium]